MQQVNFQKEFDKIPLGSYKRIDINIARLPSHTLIDMPVFVYKGEQAGKSLLLTAGVHGDEINGVVALRRLITERYLMPHVGTIIVIPLVNIYGFLQNARELPGNKDLNRSFPGTQNGSVASQIAYILTKSILPNIDYGIDFHTGGDRISNYPQIRCVLDDPTNEELASYFAPPFILNSVLIDKSFRKEAAKAGKSILVYEGGESLRLDEHSILEGIAGIKRLMHQLGMKTHIEVKTNTPSLTLHKTSWVRAKGAGIFDDYIGLGDFVRKDQLLAHITDPYGSQKVAVRSSQHGYVIGLNNMPVVNSGDALFHIAF